MNTPTAEQIEAVVLSKITAATMPFAYANGEHVGKHRRLADIGIDSLSLLDMAIELEEELGECAVIENREVSRVQTVGDLIDLIKQHAGVQDA